MMYSVDVVWFWASGLILWQASSYLNCYFKKVTRVNISIPLAPVGWTVVCVMDMFARIEAICILLWFPIKKLVVWHLIINNLLVEVDFTLGNRYRGWRWRFEIDNGIWFYFQLYNLCSYYPAIGISFSNRNGIIIFLNFRWQAPCSSWSWRWWSMYWRWLRCVV